MLASCSGGAELGQPCAISADCQPDLQCLYRSCVPRCTANFECGEGYGCDRDGECYQVLGVAGDRCSTEWDCGSRLTCVLEAEDSDGDGWLEGSCRQEQDGLPVGTTCTRDDQCRNGICAGVCSQVCVDHGDCPPPFQCATITKLIDGDVRGAFMGCHQPPPR